MANLQLATPGAERKCWVEEWTRQPVDQWDWREKKLVHQDWEKRWHAENRRLGRVVRSGIDPGGCGVLPEDTPPTKQMLKLHKGLQKAESALLTQARTSFTSEVYQALPQQLASVGLDTRRHATWPYTAYTKQEGGTIYM
jgi:hypothetical protein